MENWDNLLEKYFKGETNPIEEKALENYFAGSDVHPEHQPFEAIFKDQVWLEFPEMQADPLEKIDFNATAKRRSLHLLRKIAASLLIGITIAFFGQSIIRNNSTDFAMDQFEPASEEEALEQTLIALELLSNKFNNSTETLEKGLNGMKRASKLIKD